MYTISKQDRDSIVAYLMAAVVPSPVGANLVEIAKILNSLKEEPKKEEEGKKE